jgi:hypothetical protein
VIVDASGWPERGGPAIQRGRQAMSETAGAPASIITRNGEVRIGSFVLPDQGLSFEAEIVAAEAVGAADTSFSGRRAIVHCRFLPPNDPDGKRAAAALERRRAIDHPLLASILEAEVSDSTAYVAESVADGIRLSEHLSRAGVMPPFQVKRIVSGVAGALAALHAHGLRHGQVGLATIWVDGAGEPRLGGLLTLADPLPAADASVNGSAPVRDAVGPGTTEDLRALATVAAILLAGPPAEAALSAALDRTGRDLTGAERTVRDAIPGVAERVTSVIARGLAPSSGDRFSSAEAFAQAFGAAVDHTGEDLVAGVWEALARGDTAMARILLERARAYAPAHGDLQLLAMRLYGAGPGGILDPWRPPPSVEGAAEWQAAPHLGSNAAVADLEISLLLSSPARSAQPGKPRSNPWVVLATGIFGCILLLIILAAVALFTP